MVVNNTKVVQVTNIAPQATKDQMQTLFGYLGKIEDIRLYPTIRDVSCPVQSRICYVKFVDSSTVGIAQHMTNTVFIDRALIVIPVQGGEIPDEYYALEMTRNGTIVPGFNVNEPKLPPHVTNNVQGTGSEALIQTTDPQLEANDLPPYPPLPVGYDSVKIEETRRTILMRNIDTNAISIEDFIQYFNTNAGEVKYVRLCECPTDNTQHLLIEFTDQPTIIKALKLNGDELKGKKLEITHSIQSIIKPQAKSNEAAQKEIEEAMSRFKEAQNMISASIEPVIGMLTKDKRSSRRSRSRSPRDRERDRDRGRDRDRERRRSRRSRSRSKSRRRSRSRRRRSSSRTRKSRSRDRDRRNKRSKSRSRKRSRSRSSRRSISRRSRSTTRRSRSKSASKRRSSRHRSKSRGRSHERKSRERSRDRKRDRKSSKDKESSSSSSLRKSKEKSRESKDKKTDKESSIEESTTRKRSRSRSRSHHRRSRSKDRKKDKDRRRSRSRERRNRRSPSPRSSRKRSRSRSRDRKKEKKERKEKRDRSRSRSKVPRNYDEEEKGFDTEKEKNDKEPDSINEKDSSEKSDNMDISNSP